MEKSKKTAKIKAANEIIASGAKYLVIDLSKGHKAESFPLEKLDSEPTEGWTDEYKTKKLVLRRVMYKESPYYIGVFELTETQSSRITGKSNYGGEITDGDYDDDGSTSKFPRDRSSYEAIRGSVKGAQWPEGKDVDEGSFMGVLREKTGIISFDLPTEAQWEYACRAGGSEAAEDIKEVAWFEDTSGGLHHDVGTKKPNNFGLYDMYGNVLELCLDWYEKGTKRVIKGGGCKSYASDCYASFREGIDPTKYTNSNELFDSSKNVGFRICCASVSTAKDNEILKQQEEAELKAEEEKLAKIKEEMAPHFAKLYKDTLISHRF